MIYSDRIYGQIEIDEPVILELINSWSIQRLKEIDQAGYFEPHFPNSSRTRFEHSLGVYWLLKNYQAPLAEQIAGLIHDVSHAVFSHCIDYALDAGSETKHNYQDNIFDHFVRKSEISKILEKYGFDLEYILDDNNFPLKEKLLPDLCADRIDYSLRDLMAHGAISQSRAQGILNSLLAENNNWVFKDLESAREYAELFKEVNTKYHSGLPSALMFRTVGDYLRLALQKKYISEEDLYLTDKEVLEKISKFHGSDSKLQLLFDRMNNKVGAWIDEKDYNAKVSCKSRVVDPLFFDGGEIKRLSDIDLEWKNVVAIESQPKVYYIKFDR